MKKYKVYRITNSVNDKSYVGITSTRWLSTRFNLHKTAARHGRFNGNGVFKARLHVAMYEIGIDKFKIEVLEEVNTKQKALEREVFYIQKFDCYPNGYNGNFGDLLDRKIKQKVIPKPKKEKKLSEETCAKMSAAKLGDSRCALHFGDHTKKGGKNPRSKTYLIKHPDGKQEIVSGLREFCRLHGLHSGILTSDGRNKGYLILRRFDGHPGREYAQAGGSGENPIQLVLL